MLTTNIPVLDYIPEIIKQISRGGQALLYLARLRYGRLVVIKYFYNQTSFEREAFILGCLDHSHIIKLLAYSKYFGQPSLVLDYFPGNNFAHLLNFIFKNDKHLGPSLISYFCYQLLNILAYLERRHIVHADLAAENILVNSFGFIRLCDFASSRSYYNLEETTLCGRKDFLAPEILLGLKPTHWSDLYALGAILFEATVRRRYNINNRESDLKELRYILREYPDRIYYLISSCLSYSVWHRPASAAEALLRFGYINIKRAQAEITDLLKHANWAHPEFS